MVHVANSYTKMAPRPGKGRRGQGGESDPGEDGDGKGEVTSQLHSEHVRRYYVCSATGNSWSHPGAYEPVGRASKKATPTSNTVVACVQLLQHALEYLTLGLKLPPK